MVARSLITRDHRWGWGMFSHSVRYELTLQTDTGLRIQLDLKKSVPRKLRMNQVIVTHYGVGAVKTWVSEYARYLSQQPEIKELRYGRLFLQLDLVVNEDEESVLRYFVSGEKI